MLPVAILTDFAIFPGNGGIVLDRLGVMMGSEQREQGVHGLIVLEELQDGPAQLLLQTLDHEDECAPEF